MVCHSLAAVILMVCQVSSDRVHYYLGHGTWDVNCKESTALSAHCLSGLVAEEFDFHPKSLISTDDIFCAKKKRTKAGENVKNKHMVNDWNGIEGPFFIDSSTDC